MSKWLDFKDGYITYIGDLDIASLQAKVSELDDTHCGLTPTIISFIKSIHWQASSLSGPIQIHYLFLQTIEVIRSELSLFSSLDEKDIAVRLAREVIQLKNEIEEWIYTRDVPSFVEVSKIVYRKNPGSNNKPFRIDDISFHDMEIYVKELNSTRKQGYWAPIRKFVGSLDEQTEYIRAKLIKDIQKLSERLEKKREQLTTLDKTRTKKHEVVF